MIKNKLLDIRIIFKTYLKILWIPQGILSKFIYPFIFLENTFYFFFSKYENFVLMFFAFFLGSFIK